MKTVRVVAAVIKAKNKNEETVIFATQRGYGDLKGGWEFPGGKIETGETPQEALKREIMEELDTEISVGNMIDTIEYDYPTFHLSMDCFWCEVLRGDLALKEHEAAKWLTVEQLDDVEWLPADVTLIDRIRTDLAMKKLLEPIKKKDAKAFTHSGKFHADDVFSAALLLYLNPEITIERGNRVPDEYEGLVFDIGRGCYDHHQKNSRVRENGVPYAAFGLLWEALGAEILGEELAEKFDEAFVQPLDNNDNTGEKNELATLIGNFNPAWDAKGGSDEAFFQAVQVAGMILENKFERYRGNERADKRIEEVLAQHEQEIMDGKRDPEDAKILILPEFIPCQKRLSETEIAFVIFPSNRGGYCIQPQKREYSMNYKCSFPQEWLGLENEQLQNQTGLASAQFCHKGGFLMSVGALSDAVQACRDSLAVFEEEPVVVSIGGSEQSDALLRELPQMKAVKILYMPLPESPQLEIRGIYAEPALEKQEFKGQIKEYVKQILKRKPEAVYVEGDLFLTYPIVHQLRKKHIPVLVPFEQEGKRLIVRMPSGS